jgi:hypothetical protein
MPAENLWKDCEDIIKSGMMKSVLKEDPFSHYSEGCASTVDKLQSSVITPQFE